MAEAMAHGVWIVASFAPLLCIGAVIAFAKGRRASGTGREMASEPPYGGEQTAEYRPPSIEAAERQLGMLLRRMRVYQRAPYEFAASRILNDTDFERCVDLATALSIRIGELSGGVLAEAAERERIRHHIELSVSPKSAFPVGSQRQVATRKELRLADVFCPDLHSAQAAAPCSVAKSVGERQRDGGRKRLPVATGTAARNSASSA
jgi:hypothetical protein